jgi:hypothetical protein
VCSSDLSTAIRVFGLETVRDVLSYVQSLPREQQ